MFSPNYSRPSCLYSVLTIVETSYLYSVLTTLETSCLCSVLFTAETSYLYSVLITVKPHVYVHFNYCRYRSPVYKTVHKQADVVNTADSSVIKPEYK
jgi:hypothetical protein